MNNAVNLFHVLIIQDDVVEKSRIMRAAIDRLAAELASRGIITSLIKSYAEARPVIASDMDIDVILLTTDMKQNRNSESEALKLLALAAKFQVNVPIFLLADHENTSGAMAPELLLRSDEYIWILEDSPAFIAGRIANAASRFRRDLLPPLVQAIFDYNEKFHEYSWAAPGHQGGQGFVKTPAGRKFYDFYGENLFRTDTGIERTTIGSLLDHTGAFGESEKAAAKVFGSHISFSTIAGTSGSNRSVMQAILAPGDAALCDRNCHKSIEQGLILSGAVPVYFVPTRNRYGIIGPVPPAEFSPEAIRRKLKNSQLPISGDRKNYAVITNCTYDGICYNAAAVEELISNSVRHIHFDEAWYAYARFNPIYHDHHAMRGDPAHHHGPTVIATHSTHKLLTALSQASFIHVRNGDYPVDSEILSQSVMMHSTTSPLYAICASNDIAVKNMADNGSVLTTGIIAEAVDFRQAVARLHRHFYKKGDWFFQIWNAPEVIDHSRNKIHTFADAPKELLIRDQSVWRLHPGEVWHGFDRLPDDSWAMLDPIKVSILTPGMGDDGKLLDSGIPAALVSEYLYRNGIVPTRTTDFQLMFLFGPGITCGKWVTLLNMLLKFKELYDKNIPVSQIMPELAARGSDLSLHTLADRMFNHLKSHHPGEKLNRAFATLPAAAITPREAYMQMIKGNAEWVPYERAAGRIAACAVIPYPPGIPLVISGERFGGSDCPRLAYLKSLRNWDLEFPGFTHDIEGCKDGCVMCLKNEVCAG